MPTKKLTKTKLPVVVTREQLVTLTEHFGPYSIHAAVDAQQWFDTAGIPLKVWSGKVTKRFVEAVLQSGGHLNLRIGDRYCEGRALLGQLMDYFSISNSAQYGGRGKQFYSDRDLLLLACEATVTASLPSASNVGFFGFLKC